MHPKENAKKTRPMRGQNRSPIRTPRPRTHAFSGCLTCRQRHVKCDLRQPSCRSCERLELTCLGYGRKFSWIPTKFDRTRRSLDEEYLEVSEGVNEDDDGQTSRRMLFSEAERSAMVHQMKEECRFISSDLNLDEIFRELQKTANDFNFARIGPFGVLAIEIAHHDQMFSSEVYGREDKVDVTQHPITPTSDDVLEASLSTLVWDQLEDLPPLEPFEDDASLAVHALDLPPLSFDMSKDSFDPPCSDSVVLQPMDESSFPAITRLAPHSGNLEPRDESRDDHSVFLFPRGPNEHFCNNSSFNTTAAQQPWQFTQRESLCTAPRISNMSNGANLSKIPTEARMVLDYYSTHMVDVIAIWNGQKSPWKTIHFPCAMNTLAELLVHGEARSLAKMSLFYALLSVSSFHIGLGAKDSIQRSQYWYERGIYHQSQAESFLRLALGENVSKSERGKYKEVLMSILSMITIGVFSGDMQDCRKYLEQSENLIRTCGLPKPRKSQKVSKLHHIFSYLRIIEESTSPTLYEVEERAKADRETLVVLQRNGTVSASRLAWVEEDEPDLQDDSLFVSIYQLPTTLLSLLAQTSSLYKQLRHPESSTPEFRRRCQIVEDRIFRWTPPLDLSIAKSESTSCEYSEQLFARPIQESDVPAHLVAAMHSALIIHFQRQVRKTDPRILQHHVETTINHLLHYEKLKKAFHISSAPLPWPGFIVGCEAYDLPIRRKMETYFNSIQDYNVGNVKQMERVIREVWRRQDLGRMDTQWESVLKDWNMKIVLT